MNEKDFAEKIAFLGGRVYIVGGWCAGYTAQLPAEGQGLCNLSIERRYILERIFLRQQGWENLFPFICWK